MIRFSKRIAYTGMVVYESWEHFPKTPSSILVISQSRPLKATVAPNAQSKTLPCDGWELMLPDPPHWATS